ncbi:MAG: hypothetical protein ACI8PZ_005258 [Myxococcota bacterium]|jgi:hypothetical protein
MPLQRSLLDLARERLVEVRQDERLYLGGAITVPRSALPALRTKLWEHFREWSALADEQDLTDDDLLCMVQVQLYPVARASRPGTLNSD